MTLCRACGCAKAEKMADDTKPGAFASLLAGFGPVQKVVLFFGFIVFMMGVPQGYTLQNRTLMIGTALLMAGLAGHYWPESKHWDGNFCGETHSWQYCFPLFSPPRADLPILVISAEGVRTGRLA